MAIHFSGQTISSLGAGEEVDEVAGGTSVMGVDGIGEVGYRACEGQAAIIYGTAFTAGSRARVGAKDRTGSLLIKVVMRS